MGGTPATKKKARWLLLNTYIHTFFKRVYLNIYLKKKTTEYEKKEL